MQTELIEQLKTLRLRGKPARFYSVVDLVNQLDAEKRAGRAGQLANRLLYQDANVLDELGYLPFSQDGGSCCSIKLGARPNTVAARIFKAQNPTAIALRI